MQTKTAVKAKEPAKEKPADVKPPKPEGKAETRLFQRGPDERVWLTKEQATAEGFYWNDNPNV